MVAKSSEEVSCRTHGGDVGAHIDRVGYKQQRDQHRHYLAWHDLHHVAGETLTGNATDKRAHQLNRSH